MKRFALFPLIAVVLLFQATAVAQFKDFVTASGDKLMEGNKELRFVSYNIPDLHYIEDNQAFTSRNPWRVADEFEIRDAIEAIRQAGGRVTRMYVISVRKQDEPADIIRHVEGPGQFNEEAFRGYDKVLQIANELGIRVIIPLVDNWWWWGGPKEYADFRGKKAEEFWTDSLLISDFEKTIEHIVNRVNTCTGVPFKDDKAILGWETGNELEPSTYQWTRTIAAYIKSLDKNHLVIEGSHSETIHDEALADHNIDVVSTHHYLPAFKMIPLMMAARAKAKGKKPYFVGEFGYMPTDSIRSVLDTAISSGISGIMIWSMRQHNRDGGFYSHGPSYRWPGFAAGPRWDEKNVIRLLRTKAFEINGTAPSPIPVPAPPTLLPIKSPYKISWQGSTGAASYIVERRPKWRLFWWDWDVLDSNATDAGLAYRPLYADTTAEPGKSYYYRVMAKNLSGISGPSEPSGAVDASDKMLIDEFANDSLLFAKSPGVRIIPGGRAERAKDDWSLLHGGDGDYILYRLPGRIDSLRLDAYFSSASRDSNVVLSAGPDKDECAPVSAAREVYEPEMNVYGYYAPVRYTLRNIPSEDRFVRISLAKNIQLSRIEISYEGAATGR